MRNLLRLTLPLATVLVAGLVAAAQPKTLDATERWRAEIGA
jgi:hypothetical protein